LLLAEDRRLWHCYSPFPPPGWSGRGATARGLELHQLAGRHGLAHALGHARPGRRVRRPVRGTGAAGEPHPRGSALPNAAPRDCGAEPAAPAMAHSLREHRLVRWLSQAGLKAEPAGCWWAGLRPLWGRPISWGGCHCHLLAGVATIQAAAAQRGGVPVRCPWARDGGWCRLGAGRKGQASGLRAGGRWL